MSYTLGDLRTKVLDWLALENTSKYDAAITQAANNVSSALNRRLKIEQFKKTEGLAWDSPEPVGNQFLANGDFSWFGDLANWDVDNIQDWQWSDVDANIVSLAPRTSYGATGALQTGIDASYSFTPSLGDTVLGVFSSQILTVKKGIVYEALAHVWFDDAAVGDELTQARDVEYWDVLSLIPRSGDVIETISKNEWCTVSPGQTGNDDTDKLWSARWKFKVVAGGGVAGDDTTVEFRCGWNTSNQQVSNENTYNPVLPFTPQFQINIAYVFYDRADNPDLKTTDATLPADLGRIVEVRLDGDQVFPAEQKLSNVWNLNTEGYIKRGDKLRFAGGWSVGEEPVAEITYIYKLPDLTQLTETHAGLREYQSLYLYKALSDVSGYLEDLPAKESYKADYQEAMLEIENDAFLEQYEAGIILETKRA